MRAIHAGAAFATLLFHDAARCVLLSAAIVYERFIFTTMRADAAFDDPLICRFDY